MHMKSFLALVLLLPGCGLMGAFQKAEAPDPVDAALLRAAAVLDYQSGNAMGMGSTVPHTFDAPWDERIDVTWMGPPEPVLKAIAEEFDLRFSTFGPKRALAVRVDVRGMPLGSALALLGEQLGNAADIVIRTGEIELVYAP